MYLSAIRDQVSPELFVGSLAQMRTGGVQASPGCLPAGGDPNRGSEQTVRSPGVL